MTSDFYVIQNDVSRYGVRRVHAMRKEPLEVGERGPLEELGIPEDAYGWGWDDEVGNYHMFFAWREMMEVMVVGRGGFEVALRDAAKGYLRRFGRLPDRVIVREGTTAPELVQLEGEGVQVRAEVVRCKWMREGDVGVYVKVEEEELIHE